MQNVRRRPGYLRGLSVWEYEYCGTKQTVKILRESARAIATSPAGSCSTASTRWNRIVKQRQSSGGRCKEIETCLGEIKADLKKLQ